MYIYVYIYIYIHIYIYIYQKINSIFYLTVPDNKHKYVKEILTGNVLEESHTLCKYFLLLHWSCLFFPHLLNLKQYKLHNIRLFYILLFLDCITFHNAFLGPILVLRHKYNSHWIIDISNPGNGWLSVGNHIYLSIITLDWSKEIIFQIT